MARHGRRSGLLLLVAVAVLAAVLYVQSALSAKQDAFASRPLTQHMAILRGSSSVILGAKGEGTPRKFDDSGKPAPMEEIKETSNNLFVGFGVLTLVLLAGFVYLTVGRGD
uniref:Uncharacterized protein n=1 Tax=Alexandrium andersonii TaxID=327968 RepID=A0A7S2CXW0_9DINO|mmetsp:Transcript_44880/g.101968  ORF Transcript_44880/g.101968 Transcript_44880/m.101968 type:complete len:111 (+) Transcript_44880:55-387(+)